MLRKKGLRRCGDQTSVFIVVDLHSPLCAMQVEVVEKRRISGAKREMGCSRRRRGGGCTRHAVPALGGKCEPFNLQWTPLATEASISLGNLRRLHKYRHVRNRHRNVFHTLFAVYWQTRNVAARSARDTHSMRENGIALSLRSSSFLRCFRVFFLLSLIPAATR